MVLNGQAYHSDLEFDDCISAVRRCHTPASASGIACQNLLQSYSLAKLKPCPELGMQTFSRTISMPWGCVHHVHRLSVVSGQEGVPRYPEFNLVDHLILPNLQVRLLILPQAVKQSAEPQLMQSSQGFMMHKE